MSKVTNASRNNDVPKQKSKEVSSILSKSDVSSRKTTAEKIDQLREDLIKEFMKLTEIVQTQIEHITVHSDKSNHLLSVKEVADRLGVSTRTTETLIAEGQLRPLWVKGQRRFHPDTIAAFIQSKAAKNGRHVGGVK